LALVAAVRRGEDRCRLFALLGGGETLAKGAIYRGIRASRLQRHRLANVAVGFLSGAGQTGVYELRASRQD
jgi:hypothetical protein